MYVYRIAFDPSFGRLSPGVINTLDAIETAAAEGATRVEFLGGAERYKVELADRLEPLCQGLGLACTLREGGGRREGRRDQDADAAEAVTGAPPLLLRGPRACPSNAWEADVKYVVKALVTRARSTAWAARTDGQDEGDGLRILF